MSELDRRTLLSELALLTTGLSLVGCRRRDVVDAAEPADAEDARPKHREGDHALQPLQRAALTAACACILPSDDDPGATEADVIEYLDRELARPDFPTIRANVLAGVVALNRISARFG